MILWQICMIQSSFQVSVLQHINKYLPSPYKSHFFIDSHIYSHDYICFMANVSTTIERKSYKYAKEDNH